jgi:hypothetical protein
MRSKKVEQWDTPSIGSKLYVDALNFSEEFGFTTKEWNIQHAVTCITTFVNATRQNKIEVVVFIDAGIGSKEGSDKWRSRQEVSVRTERRGVPQGTNVLVGEIFRGLGVKVFYSGPQQDLDDCLASHATIDGANLLSNDGDYFRYTGRKYVQYGKFKVTSYGDLLLLRRVENKWKEAPEPRPILKPKPIMLVEDPSLVTLQSDFLYVRGAPSPLVKLCGNPHGKVTSLRAALYARVGVKERVLEIWPEWDEIKKEVKWHDVKIEPDCTKLALFERTPQELFTQFFGKEERPKVVDLENWEWENHLLACRAVVCELWLLGQMERRDRTLLSLLLPSSVDPLSSVVEKLQSASISKPKLELAPDSCKDFLATGYCRFDDKCFQVLGHKKCPYFPKGACRRGKDCLFYHGK